MKALEVLKKYNIHNTRPRREIVEVIFSLNRRHFSAEDILSFLRKKKSSVSRASTYRAINLFSEKNLLQTIDLGRGFKMYEMAISNNHHDHLYCIKCEKIIEFEDKNIEKLQDKVCKDNKFSSFKHTLRIVGLCRRCRNRCREDER